MHHIPSIFILQTVKLRVMQSSPLSPSDNDNEGRTSLSVCNCKFNDIDIGSISTDPSNEHGLYLNLHPADSNSIIIALKSTSDNSPSPSPSPSPSVLKVTTERSSPSAITIDKHHAKYLAEPALKQVKTFSEDTACTQNTAETDIVDVPGSNEDEDDEDDDDDEEEEFDKIGVLDLDDEDDDEELDRLKVNGAHLYQKLNLDDAATKSTPRALQNGLMKINSITSLTSISNEPTTPQSNGDGVDGEIIQIDIDTLKYQLNGMNPLSLPLYMSMYIFACLHVNV